MKRKVKGADDRFRGFLNYLSRTHPRAAERWQQEHICEAFRVHDDGVALFVEVTGRRAQREQWMMQEHTHPGKETAVAVNIFDREERLQTYLRCIWRTR
jgi:hypothetical protein